MPSAVTGGRYEHSVAGRGSPQTEAQSRDRLAPASRLLGPELTLVAEAGGGMGPGFGGFLSAGLRRGDGSR